jgi:hypothetical protein
LQKQTPSVLPQATVILPPTLPVPSQPVVTVQTQEPGYVEYLLWYGVPGALLVLILLTLFSVFLLFRKQNIDETPARVVYADVKPLAYLITQEEKSKSYPITSSTWRIGRSRDNEMTLADNSISRRHAEIQRESDGKFVLYDRGSSNGVFINNKKIAKHTLSEGDILEIGDIFLRFTQNPLDYQFADDTAMMNTRAPDFH